MITPELILAVVGPVSTMLLLYERRLAKVEQKLELTHEDLRKLQQSIERML